MARMTKGKKPAKKMTMKQYEGSKMDMKMDKKGLAAMNKKRMKGKK